MLLRHVHKQRAAAAMTAGKFNDEIVPVEIPQRKGEPIVFAKDEFVTCRHNG